MLTAAMVVRWVDVPTQVHRSKLNNVRLQPSSVVLQQYDGTVLPTKGELSVEVTYAEQARSQSFLKGGSKIKGGAKRRQKILFINYS